MNCIVLPQPLRGHMERLFPLLQGWEARYARYDQPLEEIEELLEGAEIAVGFTGEAARSIEKGNRTLRWLQALSAGVDGLPLEALARHGVALTTASGVHARPISESVFAMLLSLERGLHRAGRSQQAGDWEGLPANGTLGEIHGKTMGILGAGAIGTETARLAQAFGMRVLGLRRRQGQGEYFDRLYPQEGLNRLLEQVDYVVNILPLTPATKGLVGKDAFAAMKRGAVYISVGRGETTDTGELIRALQEGRLAGAGLDVAHPEPLPRESPLWQMGQVIITPHIAGSTVFYYDRAMDIFAENFRCWQQGKPLPRNLVEYDRGY